MTPKVTMETTVDALKVKMKDEGVAEDAVNRFVKLLDLNWDKFKTPENVNINTILGLNTKLIKFIYNYYVITKGEDNANKFANRLKDNEKEKIGAPLEK